MDDMTFTSDLDRLTKAVEAGEVAACLGLADELADAGHPHAEELALLALVVVETESEYVLTIAFTMFLSICKNAQTDEYVALCMEHINRTLKWEAEAEAQKESQS